MKFKELYDDFYEPVREEMIRFARMKGLVNYEVLARSVGLSTKPYMLQHLLPKLLGHISTDEHISRRPMLSAIVIRKDKRIPGDGFFKLAQDLRRLEIGVTEDDAIKFWKYEKKRVFTEWARGSDRRASFLPRRTATRLQRLGRVRPGAGVQRRAKHD